jgi:glycosyltransferase involved in cell wall biosynthesis
MGISFIIPCFNEAQSVANTVSSVAEAARVAAIDDVEIIVVDDGSADSTLLVAQQLSADDTRIKLCVHEKNSGLGAAYKSGLERATKRFVMLVPGDDVWPCADLVKILKKIGGADVVVPYISVAGDKGLFRRILSRSFTQIINLLFGHSLPYYNGPVIHKTATVASVLIVSNDFAYQVEALLKVLAKGATYVTIEANTVSRKFGHSSALRGRNAVSILGTIVRLFIEIRVYAALSFILRVRRASIK